MIDLHGDGVEISFSAILISTFLLSLNEFVLIKKLLYFMVTTRFSRRCFHSIDSSYSHSSTPADSRNPRACCMASHEHPLSRFLAPKKHLQMVPKCSFRRCLEPGDKLIMVGHGKGAFFPGMVWQPCIPSIQHKIPTWFSIGFAQLRGL